MTSKPQHVGSPWSKANAEYVADLFKSWGFETEIEVFHVLMPTPLERSLELVAPTRYTAILDEPAIPEDATSDVRENMLPPYNAYSADGDVEGELIFVNQGIPADYEELERLGISVKGKIVIAKYGGSWRGIKPKVAYEHGAIATILYSDPPKTTAISKATSIRKARIKWRWARSADRSPICPSILAIRLRHLLGQRKTPSA